MVTGHYTHILKVITDAKPREARQQLAIKDADGAFAVTNTGTQDVFKTHFRNLLVGRHATMTSVVAEDLNKQIARFCPGTGGDKRSDPGPREIGASI